MVGCLHLGEVQAWRTLVSAGRSLGLPTVPLPCSLQRATSLLWASVTSSVAFIHSTSCYGTLGDSESLGMGNCWYSLHASPFLVPAKVSHADSWTPADAAGRVQKLEETRELLTPLIGTGSPCPLKSSLWLCVNGFTLPDPSAVMLSPKARAMVPVNSNPEPH